MGKRLNTIRRLRSWYLKRLAERGILYAHALTSLGTMRWLFQIAMARARRAKGAAVCLEFGCGFSTVASRQIVPQQEFYTFDNSEQWNALVVELLEERGLPTSNMLCPITLAADRFRSGRADVILVDHGTAAGITDGWEARLEALPWLSKLLAPDGVMVLDDWSKRWDYSARATKLLLGLGMKVVPVTETQERRKCVFEARW